MPNLEKAKYLIEQSHSISILPSPFFIKDSFPAALALFYSLKQLGKNVNLFARNYPSKFEFLKDGQEFVSDGTDFMLSIKEGQAGLSGLSYQKTENGLNIFLKTKNKGLNTADISLKPIEEDLLIAVGIADPQKIAGFSRTNSLPLINIDNQENNQKYGQANLLENKSVCFSEITLSLLDFLNTEENNLLNKQTAQALLCGIILATNNLQKTNSKTFGWVNKLIKQGAKIEQIRNNLYGLSEKKAIALFARILDKLRTAPEQALIWALLKLEDFEQTKSSPNDLKLAIHKLSASIFPFENLLLLWEQKSSLASIRGIFYSQNEQLLNKISAIFESKRKGSGIIFKTSQTQGEKAKEKILEILTE